MSTSTDFDTIIIGAGFGGLRSLYEMRKRGLSARVLEAGTDVGGTWYWNRYPGARTDSEAWVYCFSFDKNLQEEWDWPERFPKQPQVLEYLRHVADRFEMRNDIDFETRVRSAVWDDEQSIWTVTTDGGDTHTCAHIIAASGLLSITQKPPFPGLDAFQGDWYETSRWPKEPVDLEGKRVAVVGAGATAVQVIPEVAHQASHLTVFQRTPNYVMPGRNHPLDDTRRNQIKRDYDAIWEQTLAQVFAFPMDPAGRISSDVPSDQWRQVFDAGWEAGGFRFLFETFDDLLVDQEVNDAASEFVRDKIRAIVDDPETAELLAPKTYPVGGKRPPLGHHYYETFNKPNVSLVDVLSNPVAQITPTGIRLEDGSEFEADVIIFALGFDAVTGSLTHMDVRGREGRSIAEDWAEGPRNQLGLCSVGFPNLYTILGPQGAFANLPPVIEKQVEFIGRMIDHMGEHGLSAVEAKPEAAQVWSDTCQMTLDATVLNKRPEARPWFLGANTPGKKISVLFYFGGAAPYFQALADEADAGFPGFAFDGAAVPG